MEEKELLIQIDSIFNELLKVGIGNGSSYSYGIEVKKLSDKVFELYNEVRPKYLTANDLERIASTCQEASARVPGSKPNELMKKTRQYNSQIQRDIFGVFQAIQELK